MEKTQLFTELDTTLSDLEQELNSFSEEQVNTVPFKDSWTAGELTQHLVMSNGGFAEVLNGPTKDTEGNPGGKVEKIKETFLNFSIKMNSPDFIVPPKKTYNKDSLVQALKEIHSQFEGHIKTLDLSKTCLAFELPMLGFLTRLEAISFVLYHTQRHIRQLKNIHDRVVEG